jgi:hypothetical protein
MQIVQIISLAISFAFLIVLIDFIRRGLLKEKYAILWLASVFAIIVLSAPLFRCHIDTYRKK